MKLIRDGQHIRLVLADTSHIGEPSPAFRSFVGKFHDRTLNEGVRTGAFKDELRAVLKQKVRS